MKQLSVTKYVNVQNRRRRQRLNLIAPTSIRVRIVLPDGTEVNAGWSGQRLFCISVQRTDNCDGFPPNMVLDNDVQKPAGSPQHTNCQDLERYKNIKGTFQEGCWKIGITKLEYCRNFARMLLEHCQNINATLTEYCRNNVGKLVHHSLGLGKTLLEH